MFTALRLLRHGLAFFKLVCTCLCGLDHASAVFDGIQTQFTRVITPTLQEHLRSPQKQRWNESKERSHGGVFYAIRPVRLQAKSPSPNVTDKSGIRWICCNFGYFDLISDDFTYEKRRGRESNPRIAVLQTATLPLGYPAGPQRT